MVKKIKNNIKKSFVGLLLILLLMVSVNAVNVKLLNSDPYPLKSGKYADLRLMVYDDSLVNNNNKDSNDILNGKIEFIDSFPFTILDDSLREKSFAIAQKHSDDFYELIEYRVLIDSKAVDGENLIKVKLVENGQEKIQSIPILIEKDKLQFDIGNFKTIPEKIYPDTQDVKLEIELNNFGESNLKYLVGEVNSKAFVSSSAIANRFNFGKLNSGDVKQGEFYVDVPENIKAGVYDLNLDVSFVEDDDINSKVQNTILTVPIQVLGKPDFEIGFIENEPISQGDKGEFKFKIKNIGSDEAQRVNVDLIKDSGVDIVFDKYTSYVGDLKVSQEGEGIFTFKVGRNADIKNNQVILSIRYVFEDEVFTQTKTINLDIISRDKSMFENPYVIIGAFVIIIVLGYFFRKKVHKKKSKK